MSYYERQLAPALSLALEQGKSVLLLGSRQTGKSTLCRYLKPDLEVSLMHPRLRQQYEVDAGLLIDEVQALAESLGKKPVVLIDEMQKIPELLDAVQYLIDQDVAQFLLTGSSARKLRQRGVNWLPGRVLLFYLDPLCLSELPTPPVLEQLLLFGTLPAIYTSETDALREQELMAYVETYLEDEIRTEAAVRQVGHFSTFLSLAAMDSGKLVNFTNLSKEVHVAHNTIAAYYQILEDCLIVEKIQPLTRSVKRKRLVKTPKYLFFDLGVRRLCAKENAYLPNKETLGQWFEHWVGLELLKQLRLTRQVFQLLFWRDNNGPEVDWVVQYQGDYIPIETKWTQKPTANDARHLIVFLEEYPEAKQAFLICRTPVKRQLAPNVWALPWQQLSQVLV